MSEQAYNVVREQAYTPRKKAFICNLTLQGGRTCGRSLSNAWNLKRHESLHHQAETSFRVPNNLDFVVDWRQKGGRDPSLRPSSTTTNLGSGHGANCISLQESHVDRPIPQNGSEAADWPPSPTPTNASVGLGAMVNLTIASPQLGFSSGQRMQQLHPNESALLQTIQPLPMSPVALVDETAFRGNTPTYQDQQRTPGTTTDENEGSVVLDVSPVEASSRTRPAWPQGERSQKRRYDLMGNGGSPVEVEDGGDQGSGEAQSSKRFRQFEDTPVYGRSFRAALKPLIPQYKVKLSKKGPQQLGAEWLLLTAKEAFDRKYASLLSQWGVKSGYQGTCILCPEDWASADPTSLFDCLENETPGVLRPRAWYSHAGHGTTLARARAWFQGWPRRGIELDNFMGYGPFRDMDASHLCHHGHCLVHLVLEEAPVNQSRNGCRDLAISLRRANQEIPALCSDHQPSCLLQHAALTMREVYHIQFSVLCQAHGLEPLERKPRSQRFPFSTFESALPCSFAAVAPEASMLLSEPVEQPHAQRPKLKCCFCSVPKPFASIYAFWVHIVNRHDNVGEELRLGVIKSSAVQWRAYWAKCSLGGKRDNRTYQRLLQIEQEGFGWQDVVSWDLH